VIRLRIRLIVYIKAPTYNFLYEDQDLAGKPVALGHYTYFYCNTLNSDFRALSEAFGM
jgi:hypothetical protein